jgi:colicin import membrane protein
MKQSRGIWKEPSLSKIVLISAVFHLLFISLVVIPLKTRGREFISYPVTLVGPLQTPRIDKAPLTKETETAAKEAVKERPKADISLEDVRKVAKEIERLRAISELKKRKKTDEKAQEIQISPDRVSGGTGVPGRGAGEALDLYYSIITQKIWQQWVYPDIRASGLEVIISIKIDKKGKIVFQEIEKSSGDLLFDRSAVKAISKASPLPLPPAEMEIGVRFYL